MPNIALSEAPVSSEFQSSPRPPHQAMGFDPHGPVVFLLPLRIDDDGALRGVRAT